MNNFPQKLRHLAAFVLIFGVAALVILYFLGYYDLSFLDRYKIFVKDDNATETDSSDVFSSLAGLKPDFTRDKRHAKLLLLHRQNDKRKENLLR